MDALNILHSFSALMQTFVEPFTFVLNPQKRIYWLFILSSVVLALLILKRQGKDLRENITHALSPKLWLHPSSQIDFKWLFSNQLLYVFLILPLMGSQIELILDIRNFLTAHLGRAGFTHWSTWQISATFTLALFLCDDLTRFLLHYSQHKVPLLWRFHAIHHSAEVLTPVTLYRIHFVEFLFNTCRFVLVSSIVTGIFVYAFGSKINLMNILGINVFVFLFNTLGANLRHSSVWLSFGKLEHLLISPAQHQIHHSKKSEHIDVNFGSCLSIWDKLFRSLVLSGKEQKIKYGIKTAASQTFREQLFGIKN